MRARSVAVALSLGVALVGARAWSQDDGSEHVAAKDVAGWRIYVPRPMVVRVPIADLPGRAICPAPGAKVNLSLTTNGKAVPYWLNDKRTLLVFWGEPDSGSHDARGRCYHLRESQGDGDPIVCWSDKKPRPAPVDAKKIETAVQQLVEPDEPRTYHAIETLDAAALAKGAKEGGYWCRESPLSFTLDRAGEGLLELGGIYVERVQRMPLPGGRVFQELGIRATDPIGKVSVSVNGMTVDLKLGKQGDTTAFGGIPLGAGKNTIALTAERGGKVLVQHATLRQRDAVVTPGVAFVAWGPTRFEPAEGLIAVDLQDGEPLEIKNGVIDARSGHETLVFDPMKMASHTRLEICRKHELPKLGEVTWLAVAPRAFLPALEPLAKHRAAQGTKAGLVAFEDACDDFTDGTFSAAAVAKLVAKCAPRYLLLAGDALRDGRPVEGHWLPTYLVDTYDNGASATDRLFAPKTSVAIGRFPCRTKDEVAAMVAKTIAYEKAAPAAAQSDLAFVCGEGRFGPMVDGMIENLFTQAVSKRVPSCFDVDVTYANPASVYFYPPDDFSKRVVERLSQGPLIFDYVGHGAPETLDDVHWGRKRFPIFTAEDAAKVSCPEGRYPIALITACWTGCFDEPERTVGEALALNPKGAVAVLAASRVSHPFANALLSLDLTQNLFEESTATLGERIRDTLDNLSLQSGGAEGKMVVSFGSSMLEEEGLGDRLIEDERHLYNLLGDPALVVKLPRRISVDGPASAPAGTRVTVSVPEGELALASIERVRAPRSDLAALDQGASPKILETPGTIERIRDTYRKANDLAVAKGELSGARAVLALPRDLAPGSYLVKVATRDGRVGSARLVVKKPSPLAKKYY